VPQRSAGLLLYRNRDGVTDVLLVHPGGPFWRNKDAGAGQIPKGLIEPDEAPFAAALREAAEELGKTFSGKAIPLGDFRQAGGKYVEAFALAADLDADTIVSNHIEIEWPPRSSKRQSFPEVDAARWFALDAARGMMLASQRPFLDKLAAHIASGNRADGTRPTGQDRR
jgi:predicted NUDIX family NTP pyrophosphohydrolase